MRSHQTLFSGNLPNNGENAAGKSPNRKMLACALNVLGTVEMNHQWLKIVLCPLSEAGREALLSFVLCGFTDEAEAKRAETAVENFDRYQESEIAEWILKSIVSPANGVTVSALEECLRDLLSRDLGAEESAHCESLVPGKDVVP